MGAIESIHDICADPGAYARRWKKKRGGKVIGTLCAYAPEELILAGGALGFRVVAGSGNTALSDAHLQTYSCGVVRCALDDALSGKLDFIDGALFPHTCDSIRRLSDIWRMNVNMGFHLDVGLPAKLTTPSSRNYMVAVMQKARSDLEAVLAASISDGDLRGAIAICNQIRSAMQRIDTLRADCPGLIPGRDLHAILRAATFMDRRDFLNHLNRVVLDLECRAEPGSKTGKRIFLSGGVCSNLPDLYGVIEGAGGAVVGDDLCTGLRGLRGVVAEGGDPVDAIAERYLRRAVCPAKHAGMTSRGDDLVRQARQSRSQGVIFLLLKFCDPHAFDHPYLKSRLDAANIPSLLMELEEPTEAQEQFRTRCEAFMEML